MNGSNMDEPDYWLNFSQKNGQSSRWSPMYMTTPYTPFSDFSLHLQCCHGAVLLPYNVGDYVTGRLRDEYDHQFNTFLFH